MAGWQFSCKPHLAWQAGPGVDMMFFLTRATSSQSPDDDILR